MLFGNNVCNTEFCLLSRKKSINCKNVVINVKCILSDFRSS